MLQKISSPKLKERIKEAWIDSGHENCRKIKIFQSSQGVFVHSIPHENVWRKAEASGIEGDFEKSKSRTTHATGEKETSLEFLAAAALHLGRGAVRSSHKDYSHRLCRAPLTPLEKKEEKSIHTIIIIFSRIIIVINHTMRRYKLLAVDERQMSVSNIHWIASTATKWCVCWLNGNGI